MATKKDFRPIAKEMIENALFAPAAITYGVLSTDGKIYYNRKRSIAMMIMTRGSTTDLPFDVTDANNANFSDTVYKNGNMYIRVINKDNPVAISA